MAEADSIVLEHLRGAVDGLGDDIPEVKSRLGILKTNAPTSQSAWIGLTVASSAPSQLDLVEA
jgi:hypothetical protein